MYLLEDLSTMSKITEMLEIINDGQWHTIKEIQRKTKLTRNSIKHILRFLKEYNFLTVDEKRNKVKIEENVRKFLIQTNTS